MTSRRCTRRPSTRSVAQFGSLGRVGRTASSCSADRAGTSFAHTCADRRGRVELVQAGIGSDGAMLDAAVATGARGVVMAATGAGNTSAGLLAAAERAIADGVTVVLASRCPAGAVSTAYAFPGGGATWVRAGAIPTGTLCAIKARVALALGLGAGLARGGPRDAPGRPDRLTAPCPLTR